MSVVQPNNICTDCIFLNYAGCRPGSRTTLVSAKVVKTIYAPFGIIRVIGREEGRDGLTRQAQTSPPRTRASDQGPHGRRGIGVGRKNEVEREVMATKHPPWMNGSDLLEHFFENCNLFTHEIFCGL